MYVHNDNTLIYDSFKVGSFKGNQLTIFVIYLLLPMMVGVEVESKFEVVRNNLELSSIIENLAKSQGLVVKEAVECNHADVYLDEKMELCRSGYSLRKRYVNAIFSDITLKSIKHLDGEGKIRIEEKTDKISLLKKRLIHKLKTIFQTPADEEVYSILERFEHLKPLVIITKNRQVQLINSLSQSCKVCFDTYSYLLPISNDVFMEIEIEGPLQFDRFRKAVYRKLACGRWPILRQIHYSKFDRGLKIGGML